MPDNKYQIFISSTYTDLLEARQKAIETILSMYHFPIGMEMFSAGDEHQWKVIKDTIDVSDYYIAIIGHRYGSVDSSGISYTEKEFSYAKSIDVPTLVFIQNRDAATKPSERDESIEKQDRLNSFVKRITEGQMCTFWDNTSDLSTKLAVALPKAFTQTPAIGWVRKNQRERYNEPLRVLAADNAILSKKLANAESKLSDLSSNHEQIVCELEGSLERAKIELEKTRERLWEHEEAEFIKRNLGGVKAVLIDFFEEHDHTYTSETISEITGIPHKYVTRHIDSVPGVDRIWCKDDDDMEIRYRGNANRQKLKNMGLQLS